MNRTYYGTIDKIAWASMLLINILVILKFLISVNQHFYYSLRISYIYTLISITPFSLQTLPYTPLPPPNFMYSFLKNNLRTLIRAGMCGGRAIHYSGHPDRNHNPSLAAISSQ